MRTLEESVHKGILARKAEELVSKQQKEFSVLKKSLLNSIDAAVEGMKAGIKGMASQSLKKIEPAMNNTTKSKSNTSFSKTVAAAEKKVSETVVDSFCLGMSSTPHQTTAEPPKSKLKKKRRSVSAGLKE